MLNVHSGKSIFIALKLFNGSRFFLTGKNFTVRQFQMWDKKNICSSPLFENPKGFFCFASNWTVARDSRSESYPKSIEIKFKRRSCLLQEFDLKKCDSWESERERVSEWGVWEMKVEDELDVIGVGEVGRLRVVVYTRLNDVFLFKFRDHWKIYENVTKIL